MATVSLPTFFNAPEKKLAIALGHGGLSFRELGRDFWEFAVEVAGARILSRVSNESCDACLLSESSLFVYEKRATIITCGKTSLSAAAIEILRRIPEDQISSLIYQRKAGCDRDSESLLFHEDVALIQRHLAGSVFHFCDDRQGGIHFFSADGAPRMKMTEVTDTTLEVLMHRLDPRFRDAIVAAAETRNPKRVRDAIRFSQLFPGFQVDEHVFDPPGYSLNAIRGGEYCAIHISPDEHESYASLETNRRFSGDLQEMIQRVVEVFQPEFSDVVYFQPRSRGEPTRLHGPDSFSAAQHHLRCGYDVEIRRYRHRDSTVTPGADRSRSLEARS